MKLLFSWFSLQMNHASKNQKMAVCCLAFLTCSTYSTYSTDLFMVLVPWVPRPTTTTTTATTTTATPTTAPTLLKIQREGHDKSIFIFTTFEPFWVKKNHENQRPGSFSERCSYLYSVHDLFIIKKFLKHESFETKVFLLVVRWIGGKIGQQRCYLVGFPKELVDDTKYIQQLY